MDIITHHVHVHWQISITLHNENMAHFVISYNKERLKIECILVCKIRISKLNYFKFSENAYLDKAHLKMKFAHSYSDISRYQTRLSAKNGKIYNFPVCKIRVWR